MRDIVYAPASVLYKKCETVTDFGPNLATLLDDMKRILSNMNGIGLAACQAGDALQVLIYMPLATSDDFPKKPKVLVNPRIVNKATDEVEDWEGCLSLPGLQAMVSRAVWIEIQAKNEHGKDIKVRLDKLAARIVQHEIDHLEGITLMEKVSVDKLQIVSIPIK